MNNKYTKLDLKMTSDNTPEPFECWASSTDSARSTYSAFDGNDNSYWLSKYRDSEYYKPNDINAGSIYIKLDKKYCITYIEFRPFQGPNSYYYSSTSRPYIYIYGSNDKINYEYIDKIDCYGFKNMTTYGAYIKNSKKYQIYKFKLYTDDGGESSGSFRLYYSDVIKYGIKTKDKFIGKEEHSINDNMSEVVSDFTLLTDLPINNQNNAYIIIKVRES